MHARGAHTSTGPRRQRRGPAARVTHHRFQVSRDTAGGAAPAARASLPLAGPGAAPPAASGGLPCRARRSACSAASRLLPAPACARTPLAPSRQRRARQGGPRACARRDVRGHKPLFAALLQRWARAAPGGTGLRACGRLRPSGGAGLPLQAAAEREHGGRRRTQQVRRPEAAPYSCSVLGVVSSPCQACLLRSGAGRGSRLLRMRHDALPGVLVDVWWGAGVTLRQCGRVWTRCPGLCISPGR